VEGEEKGGNGMRKRDGRECTREVKLGKVLRGLEGISQGLGPHLINLILRH